MQSPPDILEIEIVKEVCWELLHPDAYLSHRNGSDVGQCIPAKYVIVKQYFSRSDKNGTMDTIYDRRRIPPLKTGYSP
jgi:hypothetical protein